MTGQQSPEGKLYLYAIAPESNGRIFGPIGLEGAAVYSIMHGKVAAVVSAVPERLRPERRQLAAHQEVLKRLMQETSGILPVAFGVVASSPATIRAMLARNLKALREELRRVSGRVEMGLKVTWAVPNVFDYFVQTHAELRAARDRLFGRHREPSQDDKIALGRLFDRLLAEEREALTERVAEVLDPHCAEIETGKLRDEREVMSLACLIGRDRQAEFEAAVFEAAKLFDDSYAFDYNGPWPPHSFVRVKLDV